MSHRSIGRPAALALIAGMLLLILPGASVVSQGLRAFGPQAAFAHPGGLDSSGCHNDRKRGGYHCHRAASRQAPPAASTGRAYRNCTEARAAGAAPVYRGTPGYGPHLDRDDDGIGCE